LLTVLPWSILTTCQIRSYFFFFLISSAMSRHLYSSLNSWLVWILYSSEKSFIWYLNETAVYPTLMAWVCVCEYWFSCV
jgi:hypothetical protein